MMALRQPESMDDVIYFTRRKVPEFQAVCWVFKKECPKCGKGMMGKPKGNDGKVKIRAQEYVCPECSHALEKKEYEESLQANVQYTCFKCRNSGEMQVPFKRKNIDGVQTLRVKCSKCGENVDITKKMKDPKKKGTPIDDDD